MFGKFNNHINRKFFKFTPSFYLPILYKQNKKTTKLLKYVNM